MNDIGSIYDHDASKEIIRLFAFLILIPCIGVMSSGGVNFKAFTFLFSTIGGIVGFFSIYYSLTVDINKTWRKVGDFVRAGDIVSDANIVGAFLVLASMLAISGIILTDKKNIKIFFLSVFILCQTGRAFTFSTGSFLNLIFSLVIFVILCRKYFPLDYKYLKLLLGFVFFFLLSYLYISGEWDTIFYRLMMSNEHIRNESVASRIDQYTILLDYFWANPEKFIFGIGTSSMRQIMPFGLPVHNVFLKVFSIGGLISLGFYVFIIFKVLKVAISGLSHHCKAFRFFCVAFFSSFCGWIVQSQTLPAETSVIQWFYVLTGCAMSIHIQKSLSMEIQ